jgi:hypothetical protein
MDITAIPRQPSMPQSQEPTKDQPVGSQDVQDNEQQQSEGVTEQDPQEQQQQEWLNKYGKQLLELIQRTRESWQWKRRGITQKIITNKEMLKGNQSIGFYPGSADSFDPIAELSNLAGPFTDAKNGDQSMDRRPHNFYQMVENAFEAALSAEVPKNRWLPANADILDDRETAKVASRVETIIERANKIKGMLKLELMEIFTGGAYFKLTRYVVDADRTGTHKETVLQLVATDVLPARFVCFNCGTSTDESELVAQKTLQCPQCGAPLSQENYFESHVEQIPVGEEKDDVPNGMVLQDVYGGLQVDADPDADGIRSTRLLNLSLEVSLGWLRTTFPKMWEQFEWGQSTGNGNDSQDRQYRDMLTSPGNSPNQGAASSQTKPTYSRTWCQPELFAELDDPTLGKEMQKTFPKGLMLASTGDIPLQIRPAKMTDEWTWCGSKKGFGLYPPPVGDPAVPLQQDINDGTSKIREYMDRLACGILLANQQYLDTKAMNNKSLLPGVLNPVAFKKNSPLSNISELIFQVKAEMDAAIFSYVSTLKQDMQLLVGTPPQTFGAGTQQGVETFGGQELQHDTGMMKLGLTWDLIREEHAESGENAVNCAAKNMTDDWQNVVADETDEFRNEYVHLDQMKGSVHAEPETDQGFPMTYSEIKSFYEQLMQSSDEMLVQWLMSEPANVDNAIRYIGVPGLIAPGASMRTKILRVIDQLMQPGAQPSMQPDPITGAPTEIPSVMPNKYLDDLAASQKLIESWSQEHWDKCEQNPPGLANLVAYYRMCVQFDKEKAAEQAIAPPPIAGQPQLPGGSTPPGMA